MSVLAEREPVANWEAEEDDYLDLLESHAVFVIREVAAECSRPAVLFSGGKDSAVVLRLVEKAFRPDPIPFPLVHIDTGHNFPETISFRDDTARRLDLSLVVGSVEEAIARHLVEDPGPGRSRNQQQSKTLLDTISRHSLGACIGGARRDEDKARAKERLMSVRGGDGGWDPAHQRPELWQLYIGRVAPGEHLRVFPLSDWTEMDVWRYIRREGVALPSIYFAHRRPVVRRNGMWLAVSSWVVPEPDEEVRELSVRFRTVGDATTTGAVLSTAATIDEVIAELAASRVSERGETRGDDQFSEASMEDRKREGYF